MGTSISGERGRNFAAGLPKKMTLGKWQCQFSRVFSYHVNGAVDRSSKQAGTRCTNKNRFSFVKSL